jgi:hypothetical protein
MPERAGIFDSNPIELDTSGFKPKAPAETRKNVPDREAVEAVSEAANFPSREPASRKKPPQAVKKARRVHRTGRNIQLNVKVSLETQELIYAITDQNGWVLGETVEHAIAALQRELASQK